MLCSVSSGASRRRNRCCEIGGGRRSRRLNTDRVGAATPLRSRFRPRRKFAHHVSHPRFHYRVGLHIDVFEVCSAFTRVAACTRARLPIRDRYPKASDISSPPCLLRLLPAGAVAGWGLHPLESAAFSRRTWEAVTRLSGLNDAGARSRHPSRGPDVQERPRYSGSPVARSASLREAASAGAQSTPENCRLHRNAGCNSKTRAAAALASSSRPSFASGAASSI
jgi:hypothetical protein